MHYDVIVVGVGGMGSAAVYQLAKRGHRVLGLEQFDIPHDQGSSHGINRIIRLAYYEDPRYVPLLKRAYTLWRELEKVSNEKILHVTGSVDASHEDEDIFQGSYKTCLEHELNHEILDAGSLQQRFPGYELPEGYKAVYQEEGGFVLSECCIINHVTVAQSFGADVRAREKVLGWDIHKDVVTVRTERGSYETGKLIITAGPWAAQLLPELRSYAIPERQVLGWFQPLKPEQFQPTSFPVFNLKVPEGYYYGFPVYGVPGFKIGKYNHLEENTKADTVDRHIYAQDEAVLRACVRKYFPQANGPTMMLKTCMFTNSPDEHFLIGQHPESPHLVLAAGFSGHGYKFCSVVGEILADLATSGKTQHDISLFQLERYLKGAS
ncbi:MAG: N-methyl-L-tryptophan oxidase [Trueperaceae bacterium]